MQPAREDLLVELSSGVRSFFLQAISWLAVGAVAVGIFLNYDRLLKGTGSSHDGSVSVPNVGVAVTSAPSSGTVELKSSGNGHYQARADINGRSMPVVVDTGASLVVLTYDDAQRAGIYLKPSDFTQPVATANGTSRVALVNLERVSVGSITVRNVRGAVADRGSLQVTLLGMSFLNQLDRVDMRDGVMVLKN